MYSADITAVFLAVSLWIFGCQSLENLGFMNAELLVEKELCGYKSQWFMNQQIPLGLGHSATVQNHTLILKSNMFR